MGSAIIHGAIRAGVLDPERVAVVDPNAEKRAGFAKSFPEAGEGVEWCRAGDGVIVLAVKPQMLETATEQIRRAVVGGEPLVISILAGTRSSSVLEAMGAGVRVVRVMPNTPAAIGMGMSAIAKGPGATEQDLDLSRALFGAIGETVEIDESLMDAFTGLAGSGPAYVFYLAEGMLNAARSMGFGEEQAVKIVRQTIAGSGMLLAGSSELPSELRARVTSKGGTTAAGTGSLDDRGVMNAIERAIIAARDRGEELGRQ
ncbi:MAG: pyrroline-5-carboxylate reductase [Phycisphaerales bacterium]|nr:pyrroline-5-carboxylate reductase [Phycisphaerales bacterium]